MARIQGTAVAKFDSGPPITLQGEWNVDIGVPAFYAYGQGDGSEGSGYIGADIGTAQDVAGGFNFVVDKSGEIIKDTIRRGLFGFFTLDWPVGDPALGQNNGRAIDCHFVKMTFKVNNPEGQYIISGQMKAGKVEGPMFRPL